MSRPGTPRPVSILGVYYGGRNYEAELGSNEDKAP